MNGVHLATGTNELTANNAIETDALPTLPQARAAHRGRWLPRSASIFSSDPSSHE